MPRRILRSTLEQRLASKWARYWWGDADQVQNRILCGLSRDDLLALPWLATLLDELRKAKGESGYFRKQTLVAYLRSSPALASAFRRRKWVPLTPPLEALLEEEKKAWDAPDIPSLGALSDFLELRSIRHLDWLVLPHCRRQTTVEHYGFACITKRGGAMRFLEPPRPQLKRVQRIIQRNILYRIPVHSACHGFQTGRSTITAAVPHCGSDLLLRIDLKDFFLSISSRRVRAFFDRVYPPDVARSLAWLCTAPGKLQRRELHPLLGNPHLPQGAPTSPTLSNVLGYRMDCRLAGLSDCYHATYTRYADDLIFGFRRRHSRETIQTFATTVAVIVMEEGFQVNFRKTRVAGRGERQTVLGWSVNETVNTPRLEFENLKAELYNCVRTGPDAQNRSGHPAYREHLLGRIARVGSVNTVKADKLQRLFDRIVWADGLLE